MAFFSRTARFLSVCFTVVILFIGCTRLNRPDGSPHPCQSVLNHALKDPNAYSLYINSSGNLYDFDKKPVTDPNAYLGKIFENYNRVINADQRMQLTVFIHGGLNTSQSVSERVEQLWQPMLADCKYPLFISWRSGFPHNYLDHLLFLRRGEYDSTGDGSFFDGASDFIKGPLTAPFVLMEDTLRAVSRIPASTYHMLLDQNITLQNVAGSTLNTDNLDATGDETQIRGIHLHMQKSKDEEQLEFKDLWSIANPIKLVTAPYVDSLGSGAWNSMLRRTDLVLSPAAPGSWTAEAKQTVPDDTRSCPVEIRNGITPVSEFFNVWQCKYPGKPIHLIGHSMGSIIGNKILANNPEINFTRIVYMAAACSLNDIAEIVSPYLTHHPDSEFYNLSLDPLRDQFENSSYIDAVPRGSLLWWIDNTIGTVNSFEDRTAGYWNNIIKGAPHIFPEKIRKQVHLTKFGMDARSPQSHGSFGDFPFWQENFWAGATD